MCHGVIRSRRTQTGPVSLFTGVRQQSSNQELLGVTSREGAQLTIAARWCICGINRAYFALGGGSTSGAAGTRTHRLGRSANECVKKGGYRETVVNECVTSPRTLQQGSACEYNTGHTYTGGGAQSTGGDCTSAASSAEQRGTDVGKEMAARPKTASPRS
jgi:hypothetical protein